MKFSELEALMHDKEIFTLAEIARNLNSSPQAVSNWKARDQVPNHIIAQVKSSQLTSSKSQSHQIFSSQQKFNEDSISLSDILLSMAQQLKIILLVPFITIFISFTYVKFIQEPLYVSTVKVLLPQSRAGGLGGLSGLASQFGVNVPSGVQADLSSPSLFPELLKSRKFAEKILEKKFGYINWLGAFTLYKKEILRFLNVAIQTIISPLVTALLFLIYLQYQRPLYAQVCILFVPLSFYDRRYSHDYLLINSFLVP